MIGVVTFEFNTSMILLPQKANEKRAFDKRVGYFVNDYDVLKKIPKKKLIKKFLLLDGD